MTEGVTCVLSNFKSVLLFCLVFCLGSINVQAAEAPAPATAQSSAPADSAPADEPAKPEILVKGGLLGAISSSIDSVQNKLDLDAHLLDSWRLRADRAADELDALVNKPSSRSPWAIVGDFLILSAVWIGAFVLLNRVGKFVANRVSRHRLLNRRERVQGVLGYVLPFTIAAVICLPLTLYVSHFMQASIGRALALCLAYSTSSGIFSTSVLMSVVVLFNSGHKRAAVRIIRNYAPHPLFIIGFLAALSDALTSPQISRQLGGNVTTSVAAFTGLMASIMFCIVVIRMRRPVAHLIRNRPLSARLTRPALQQTLKIFSSLWHLPILLMILVSAVNLIGAGEDSQEALRCALLTTVLLIGTVFLSTLFQHMFKPAEARTGRVYKERLLSLLHAVLRIGLAIGFIELLGRIWGFSLFEFAQRNALGKVISDSLSSIGLIFQQHQLLAPLTVADNILFQYRLNEGKKNSKQAAKSVQQEKQALQILAERLGIAHKLHVLPHQLSGGEQQRVGIARALIHQPQLILADEPTGNLDQERSIEVVKLMTALCKELNINLIMVTHSQQLAHYFERVLYLKAGCLEEMPRPSESFF